MLVGRPRRPERFEVESTVEAGVDITLDRQADFGPLRAGERAPKIGFRLVHELAAHGVDVAVACLVLGVSRSGYYYWRDRPPSVRDLEDAYRANTIVDIHDMSRASYGAPGTCRAANGPGSACWPQAGRPAAAAGPAARHQPRPQARTPPRRGRSRGPRAAQLGPDGSDSLWCTDITEHPTRAGKVYCCAVLDGFSRAVVGWSIADHMRTELVVDAQQMATWRRRPGPGVIAHSERGSEHTSWVFGHRLRDAGLLGSMGRVASSVDNSMIESSWSTMQRELLDTPAWSRPDQLGSAIFEWIEAWYNPRRRHTALKHAQPRRFEALHTAAQPAA